MEITNTGIRIDELNRHELRSENNEMIRQYKKDVQHRAEHIAQTYMITIFRDDEETPRSIYLYPNAIEATSGYNNYTDWGFAKEYLTVSLYEPNGLVHTKILHRPRGGECTFVRKDYIEVSEILSNMKDNIDEKTYQNLVTEFAKIFSKDNQRFDEERFFRNCRVED